MFVGLASHVKLLYAWITLTCTFKYTILQRSMQTIILTWENMDHFHFRFKSNVTESYI